MLFFIFILQIKQLICIFIKYLFYFNYLFILITSFYRQISKQQDDLIFSSDESNLSTSSSNQEDFEEGQNFNYYENLFNDDKIEEIFTSKDFLDLHKQEIKEEMPDYNEFMKEQAEQYYNLSFNTGGCKASWQKLLNQTYNIQQTYLQNIIEQFVTNQLFEITQFQQKVRENNDFKYFEPILNKNIKIEQQIQEAMNKYIQELINYEQILKDQIQFIDISLQSSSEYIKLLQKISNTETLYQQFIQRVQKQENYEELSQQISHYNYKEDFEEIIQDIYDVVKQSENTQGFGFEMYQQANYGITDEVREKLNIQECQNENDISDKLLQYKQSLSKYMQYQNQQKQCYHNIHQIIKNLLNGQDIASQLQLLQCITQLIQNQNENNIYFLQFGKDNFIEIILIQIKQKVQQTLNKLISINKFSHLISLDQIYQNDLLLLLDDYLYSEENVRRYCLLAKENKQQATQWLQQLLHFTVQYLSNAKVTVFLDDMKHCQINNIQKVQQEFNQEETAIDITNPQLFDVKPQQTVYNLQNSLASIMFIKDQPIIYNWQQVARGVHRINWWLLEVIKQNKSQSEKIQINTSQIQYQQTQDTINLPMINMQKVEKQICQNIYQESQQFISLSYYQQIKQFLSQSPCTLDLQNSFNSIDEQDPYYKEVSLAINNFNSCVATVSQIKGRKYQSVFTIVDKQGKYRAHLVLDSYQEQLFNPLWSKDFKNWYRGNKEAGIRQIQRREFEEQYRKALFTSNNKSYSPYQLIQRILQEARLQDFLVCHGAANIIVLNNGDETCNKLTQNLKQTQYFLNQQIDERVFTDEGKVKSMNDFCQYLYVNYELSKDGCNNITLFPNFIFKQQQKASFINNIQLQEIFTNIPYQLQKIYQINKYDCYNQNIDRRIYTRNIDAKNLMEQNINNIKRILSEDFIQTINLTTKYDEQTNTISINTFNNLKVTKNEEQINDVSKDPLEMVISTLIWTARYYYHPLEVIACLTEGGKYTNRLLQVKGMQDCTLINTTEQENQYQKQFASQKKLQQMLQSLLQSKNTLQLIDQAIRFQIIRKTVDLNSCFISSWYIYQYLYLPNINAQKLNRILYLLQNKTSDLQLENRNNQYIKNNEKYLQKLQQIKAQYQGKQYIDELTNPQFEFQHQKQQLTNMNILLRPLNSEINDSQRQITIFTSKYQLSDCIFTQLIQSYIFNKLESEKENSVIIDQQLQDLMQNCNTSLSIQKQILLVQNLQDSQYLNYDQELQQIPQNELNQIIQQSNDLFQNIQMHTIISQEVISQLPVYSGFVPLDREALMRNENSSCIYTIAALYRCYGQFQLEQFSIFQNMENRDAIYDTKSFQQLLDQNYHCKLPEDYQACNVVAIKSLDGLGILDDNSEQEFNFDEDYYESAKQKRQNKQKQLEPIYSDILEGNPISQIQWWDTMPINAKQAQIIMIICVLLTKCQKQDIENQIQNITSAVNQVFNQMNNNEDIDMSDLYQASFNIQLDDKQFVLNQNDQLLQNNQVIEQLNKQLTQQNGNQNILKYIQSSQYFDYIIQQYYNQDQTQQQKQSSIASSMDEEEDFEQQIKQGLLLPLCQLYQDYYNPISQFDSILQYKLKNLDFNKLQDILKYYDEYLVKAIYLLLLNSKQYSCDSLYDTLMTLTYQQEYNNNDQNKEFQENITIKEAVSIINQYKNGISYKEKTNFLHLNKNTNQKLIQQIMDQLQIKNPQQLGLFTPIQVRLQMSKIERFKQLQQLKDDEVIKVILQQNDSLQSVLNCTNLNEVVNVSYPFTSFIYGIFDDLQCPFLLKNVFYTYDNGKRQYQSIGDNYGRVLSLQFMSLLLNYIISTIMEHQDLSKQQLEDVIDKSYENNCFTCDKYQVNVNDIQQQKYITNDTQDQINNEKINNRLVQIANIQLIQQYLLNQSDDQQNNNIIFTESQKKQILEQFQILTNIDGEYNIYQTQNMIESQIGLSQFQSQYQIMQQNTQQTDNYFTFLTNQFINPVTYYNIQATLMSKQLNYMASKQLMYQQEKKQFKRISSNKLFKSDIYMENTNQILQCLEKDSVIFIPVRNNYNKIYACFQSVQKDINNQQVVFLPLTEIKDQDANEEQVCEHVELQYDSLFEISSDLNQIFNSFDEVIQYIQKLRDFIDEPQRIVQPQKLLEYRTKDKYIKYICQNAKYNCYKYEIKRHKDGSTYNGEIYIVNNGIIFRNAFIELNKLSQFTKKVIRGELQKFQYNEKDNKYYKTMLKE